MDLDSRRLSTVRNLDPADQLREIASRLKKPLTGVFSLAFPQPQTMTREKGLYGFYYGKPIRRLASALSVDREILILFSTFSEQQQRTVKIAKELIAESEGRLENTVSIIVHSDPDGNVKLPKWGRNIGLVVLPIYASRMPQSVEELENHLCHEIFSHDPFDVTGPVSDDENFFGRRNEALDLVRKLQKGQIRSNLGIRKIGKTSIMNRVIWEAKEHYDCSCVLLDCSLDEIWSLDASGLMRSLAGAVKQMQADAQGYIRVAAVESNQTLSQATQDLQTTITMSDKPVIVFIDEVDYITPGSPTSTAWRQEFNKFWRNFRAVYQEATRNGSTVSVMVSGVSAKWFSVSAIEGIENAALSFIPEEYLSPLPRRAGIGMLKKIARKAGLSMSDAAADAVAAATGDMPFWMRKAGSYIHQQVDVTSRPTTLEPAQVAPLLEEFLIKEGSTLGQVAITHLFSVYPELKQPSFKLLDGEGEKIPSKFLTILQKYGICTITGRLKPSGRMIEMALQAYREQGIAEATSTEPAQPRQTTSLADWAEELAVINKTRNVLEKRLRQLVVNFLRADSLSNKARGTAKERVLSSLPSERKKPLETLSADDLMDKLYWLELSSIIKREWGLFANVFGDRKVFDEHFTIANERPDTHAKDADLADIALQRRSLKWISDRLASV